MIMGIVNQIFFHRKMERSIQRKESFVRHVIGSDSESTIKSVFDQTLTFEASPYALIYTATSTWVLGFREVVIWDELTC